jgi:DNA-binding response OmpR family regulator
MSNRKILIVENEKRTARLLKARLQERGFTVALASNGEEGLWKAVTERPRAVILNALLPYVDGWEICEAIKYDPATGHIPVIVLASRLRVNEYAKAFLTRSDACILEPADPEECIAVVNRLVSDRA